MPQMRKLAVVLIVTAWVVAPSHAQCVLFDAPHGTPDPAYSTMARADFDGDGKLDALATDRAIYLGMTQRVAVPQLSGVSVERITDVNGDGRPDIVGTNFDGLVVLVNNGNLTFTTKTTKLQMNYGYSWLFWGDFNADGLLDVFSPAVFDPFFQSTPIYLAAGDGTFKLEYGMDFTGLANGRILILADVNGDHRSDIVHNNGLRVTMYLRQANGFAAPTQGPTLPGYPVSAADFNRDGRDDVMFVSGVSTTTSTIYFDLAGASPRASVSFAGYAYIADFNGDGAPDIWVLTFASEYTGVQIHLNDGQGNFRQTEWLPSYVPVSGVADADGDGILDLLSNYGSETYALPGNGDGTFRVPRIAFPPTATAIAGDFDGDGDDDVAYPKAIAWNNGDLTFRIAPTADTRMVQPLRAGDVDGDGKAELVTFNAGLVFVLSPRPDGIIEEVARIGASALDVAIGDFSGKHKPELAMLTGFQVGQRVEVYEIRTGANRRYDILTGGPALNIIATDLNRDGADDIVTSGGVKTVVVPNVPYYPGHDGFLQALVSTGTSFEEHRAAFPNMALHALVAGDFDGDGKGDVAATAAYYPSGQVWAFFGDGKGAFPRDQMMLFSAPEPTFRLLASDFDRDGRTDLAVNGARRVFHGTAAGLVDLRHYFGARAAEFPQDRPNLPYVALLLRLRKGEAPSIVVPTQYSDVAYVYRPLCARPRPARR